MNVHSICGAFVNAGIHLNEFVCKILFLKATESTKKLIGLDFTVLKKNGIDRAEDRPSLDQ